MKTVQTQLDSTSPGASADEDIREQMWRRLPRWLQPWLTEVTGKAATHETAPWRWTWWSRLAVALVWLTLSTLASGWLVEQSPPWWLLIPLPWLVATSVMQTLQTNFLHHASHGNLSGKQRFDQLISEALSVLILYRPFAAYQPDHLLHHGRLGLVDDVDLQFIVRLGFVPGMSRHFYWGQFWRTIFSPGFHGRWILSRLRANFVTASPLRRAAAVAYSGGLVLIATWVGAWTLLLAWLVPIFVLLQISLFLQLVTEHTWVRRPDKNVRASIASLTYDRYFGEPLPRNNAAYGWTVWWLRFAFIHLPSRMLVAPGDLANHSWHHRHPLARALWPNAAYARRDDLTSGHQGWPAYTEIWGVRAMFNATFDALGGLPRDATLGQPETYNKL